MKTFETEKHNIPEGATHYSDEDSDRYLCWYKDVDGKGQIMLSGDCGFSGTWWPCEHNEHLEAGIKPIPQTNIETPEEKEALDTMTGISREHLMKVIEKQTETITKLIERIDDAELESYSSKGLNTSESPSGSAWDGEGLPPVGIECEAVFIEHQHKGYGEFLILGYHGDYVWMEYIGELPNKSKHYTAKIGLVKFRKLETQQDREDREKLEAAYDLYCKLSVFGGDFEQFCENTVSRKFWLEIVKETRYRK